MNELVNVTVGDGIAVLTLNDPKRRNAVSVEMSVELRSAVTAMEADTDVHAVVVTGAGRAFCAGANLTALGTATEEGLKALYDGFLAVAECSLPTIAAVNGPAVGAGLNLALAADVRIAGRDAVFEPGFQRLGIHPGGGATYMLQRAVGVQAARAALLFGMRFDADEAVRSGLALRTAEDSVASALELAGAAVRAPRALVMTTKASMRATANPGFEDIAQHHAAVAVELPPQADSIRSPEFARRLAEAQGAGRPSSQQS
ncbi:putative enoyl-CoA hydratase echA14 [Mycolicibacterium vanbaalenii]|uniref:Putative enoyl-CoA hydratase echA14 n=1 Tax=Mycolicibacterium vanbaalenii TaxID=110539 RepID=A0A5S9R9W0_MYCVN|nr:enoyl-CoA hydratase [Mycolicibacterium vanbaalenii]CAA0137676.1 putative enoyl-CoA hydratase echA14 [Mycolicibacterium vanbaalenii]